MPHQRSQKDFVFGGELPRRFPRGARERGEPKRGGEIRAPVMNSPLQDRKKKPVYT